MEILLLIAIVVIGAGIYLNRKPAEKQVVESEGYSDNGIKFSKD